MQGVGCTLQFIIRKVDRLDLQLASSLVIRQRCSGVHFLVSKWKRAKACTRAQHDRVFADAFRTLRCF
jgi:hypothetical protein